MHPVMRHTISVPTEQAFDHVRFLREVWLERYVPLALVGDALDAFLDDIFQERDTGAVIVRVHLSIHHALLCLVQLHAQFA